VFYGRSVYALALPGRKYDFRARAGELLWALRKLRR